MIFQRLLALALLSYSSYTDLKTRLVSLAAVIGAIVLSAVAGVVFEERGFGTLLFGALPGVFLLVISRLSKRAFGEGDAYIFMALGIMLGVRESICILTVSLVMASVLGIGFLAVCKRKKKYSMPFLPFVLLAYLSVMLVNCTSC